MPVNLRKNRIAQFIVEYLDANNNITIPAGGNIIITYTSGTTTASTNITLTKVGSFFTGRWDTAVADYGPGSYQVTTEISSIVISTGSLRIIN